MSAPKRNGTYVSQIDQRTDTPGVYRRGSQYRVLTRPDGKRKVMHLFATYEEAVAFKASTPNRRSGRRGRIRQRWSGRREQMAALAILRRDPCAYCGARGEELDHIDPQAKGGTNHWTNLTASCGRCNRAKSDKPLLIFLAHQNGCYVWRRDKRGSAQAR